MMKEIKTVILIGIKLKEDRIRLDRRNNLTLELLPREAMDSFSLERFKVG